MRVPCRIMPNAGTDPWTQQEVSGTFGNAFIFTPFRIRFYDSSVQSILLLVGSTLLCSKVNVSCLCAAASVNAGRNGLETDTKHE